LVGGDLRELVSRSTFICQNAVYQLQAHLLGRVVPLTPGETKLAGSLNACPMCRADLGILVAPARRGRTDAVAFCGPQDEITARADAPPQRARLPAASGRDLDALMSRGLDDLMT